MPVYRVRHPTSEDGLERRVVQLVYSNDGAMLQQPLARSPNTSSLQEYDGYYQVDMSGNYTPIDYTEHWKDHFSFGHANCNLEEISL